jgi:anaerobic dimethyl sulfoxide reductase subunit C (anchor subunit)
MEVQWSLIIFTLFICLASGVFAGQGLLTLLGKGEKLQMPALIVSLVALIVGGIASFTHLQHWDRAFNGFGNLTSGITQELIGIVVLFVLIVIYFVVARRGKIPTWAGVLAVIGGVGLVLIMANSYLMPARPAWSTPLLHLFYLAQMIVSGGATLWLIGAAVKSDDSLVISARLTAIGGACVVLSLVAYALYANVLTLPTVGNYFDPTDPTKPMVATEALGTELLAGGLAAYFWGALIIGGVIAAILGFLKWNKAEANLGFATVALLCALAGGFAFRAALYLMGISAYAFY